MIFRRRLAPPGAKGCLSAEGSEGLLVSGATSVEARFKRDGKQLLTTPRSSARLISAPLSTVLGLVVFCLATLAPKMTETAVANGDTRTIHLYHAHTHESISATYLVNGQYDAQVLQQLNWFLRDWRRDEPTNMDPRLFDVVWEAYRSRRRRRSGRACRLRLSLSRDKRHAARPFARRRQIFPAHARQGDGHHHAGNADVANSRDRHAHAARRRRLLSDGGHAFRPSRRRQCSSTGRA